MPRPRESSPTSATVMLLIGLILVGLGPAPAVLQRLPLGGRALHELRGAWLRGRERDLDPQGRPGGDAAPLLPSRLADQGDRRRRGPAHRSSSRRARVHPTDLPPGPPHRWAASRVGRRGSPDAEPLPDLLRNGGQGLQPDDVLLPAGRFGPVDRNRHWPGPVVGRLRTLGGGRRLHPLHVGVRPAGAVRLGVSRQAREPAAAAAGQSRGGSSLSALGARASR